MLLNAAHYKNIRAIIRPKTAPAVHSHPADVALYLLFMDSVRLRVIHKWMVLNTHYPNWCALTASRIAVKI